MTTNLAPGTAVRVWSMAGPCLTGFRVVKVNRTTADVESYGTTWRKPLRSIHAEPCDSCTDHPSTHYPNGYLD